MKGLNPCRSHFKSRLSLIVLVNVVLNRTVVADSECGDVLDNIHESADLEVPLKTSYAIYSKAISGR